MSICRRRIVEAVAVVLTAGVLLAPLSGTALAHQHLFNPSGTCPNSNANVPQGLTNPAGNTPGNRNNAAGNEQGSAHCANR